MLAIDPENTHDYIDVDDFEKYLDMYAKMQVENREITFRMCTRVGSQHKEIEILKKGKSRGMYITKQDIWDAAKSDDGSSSGSRSPEVLTDEPSLKMQRAINEDIDI